MKKQQMPANGITPYPYNHENWLKNVEYWKTLKRPDNRDVTEVMLEPITGRITDEGNKEAEVSDTELPTDNRRMPRSNKNTRSRTE